MSAARALATETDAQVLARIADGDLGALGALYDRHHASLRRFVARATSGGADVDDLVHITFLEAAESATRFDGRASARTWLIGIALNHVRRRRRAWSRFVEILGSLTRPEPVSPRHELRSDLDRALARLSEAKRTTFLLAELEELSGPEIAALLNVPVNTVWTRLHTARRELRAMLDEDAT